MFTFFNTCNQCICRDCNGNIRVSNGWNSWNGCNRCNSCNYCNICNGFSSNTTSSTNGTSNEAANGSSGYNYGCVRGCGYNVTSRNVNESSSCWANRCRRSSYGCDCNG
ncbi:MAG: hypothetical protein IJ373_05145 [Clostridia bacterium]|nr:hypothetical protein [Clostridia bacterium]MBQ8446695.1 hypothetical protein [Clostridia bacterium]